MAIDHTLFALKRFTGTSKLNSRRAKAFTIDECNFVYKVIINNNITCVPIALVQFSRSAAQYVLTTLDLTEHPDNPFAVVNTHTSNSSSDVTTWIDVLYAPEYMVNGDVQNPIFKKISFRANSLGDTISAGGYKGYRPQDFQYSIPEDYIPFGITKMKVPGTSYFAFNTLDIYDDSQYIDLVQMVNTYSGDRTINSPPELEITFIRADMMDSSLKKRLYYDTIGDGTWLSMSPRRYESQYYDLINCDKIMVGDTVTASVQPETDPCYNYNMRVLPYTGYQDEYTGGTVYQDSTCTFTMPDYDVMVVSRKTPKPPFHNIQGFTTASATVAANSQKTITTTAANYSVPVGYSPILAGFINGRGDIRFSRVLTLADSTTLANIRNNTGTDRTIATTINITGLRKNLVTDIRNGETFSGIPYFILVRHTATYSVNSGKNARINGTSFSPVLQDTYTLSNYGEYRPVGIVNMYSGSTNIMVTGISLFSKDKGYYHNCVYVKNDSSSNASSMTFTLDILYAHPGIFGSNFEYKHYTTFVEDIANNGTSSITAEEITAPIRPVGLLSCGADVFKLTNDEYAYAIGGVCSGAKLYPTSNTNVILRSRNESGVTAASLDTYMSYTSFINDDVATDLILTYDYCTINDITVNMINNDVGLFTPTIDSEFSITLPRAIGSILEIPISRSGKTVQQNGETIHYVTSIASVTGSGIELVSHTEYRIYVRLLSSSASIVINCEPTITSDPRPF